MKKILIILFLVLMFPINVYAAKDNEVNVNDNGKVQNLYNYISNMRNEFEGLNDLDPKTYVSSFLKSAKSLL